MNKTPPGWNPMSGAPRDGRQILALHRTHGVVEARFHPGGWSEDTPVAPAEYDGAVWVLGDDVAQVEVEEFGKDAPEPYHDGELIGWLPRETLPAAPDQP